MGRREEELGLAAFGLHLVAAVPPTAGAVPAAFGLGGEQDAGEMEPLDAALLVVAADHLAKGDLLAQAVRGLVGVDGGLGRRGHAPSPLLLAPLAPSQLVVVAPRVRGPPPALLLGLPAAAARRVGCGGGLLVVMAPLAARALGGLPPGLGLVVEVAVVLVKLAHLVLYEILDLLQQLKLVVAQLLGLDERVLDLQHDLLAANLQVGLPQQALLLLELRQDLYVTREAKIRSGGNKAACSGMPAHVVKMWKSFAARTLEPPMQWLRKVG